MASPKDGIVKTPARSLGFVPAVDNFASPRTIYSKSSPGGSVTTASETKVQIRIQEMWAEKQCDAFASWINYTFQPIEHATHENTQSEEPNVLGGKGRAAFRTLLLHQHNSHARKRAGEIYDSDEMKAIRSSIRAEVTSGRLATRTDQEVFANIGLRDQLFSILLSYSTRWLQLGLETVFGEAVSNHLPATGRAALITTMPSEVTKVRLMVLTRVTSLPVLLSFGLF